MFPSMIWNSLDLVHRISTFRKYPERGNSYLLQYLVSSRSVFVCFKTPPFSHPSIHVPSSDLLPPPFPEKVLSVLRYSSPHSYPNFLLYAIKIQFSFSCFIYGKQILNCLYFTLQCALADSNLLKYRTVVIPKVYIMMHLSMVDLPD